MLLATANVNSDDVSLFTVDCGMPMTTTTGGMSTTTGSVTSIEESGASRVETVAGYIVLLTGMIEQ